MTCVDYWQPMGAEMFVSKTFVSQLIPLKQSAGVLYVTDTVQSWGSLLAHWGTHEPLPPSTVVWNTVRVKPGSHAPPMV